MKKYSHGFVPEEVLFSPSSDCNLKCPHCDIKKYKINLSARAAVRFLDECVRYGIKRVGFTGGEPFLFPGFLCAVIRKAVSKNMYFDRITTNGAWWKNENEMKNVISALYSAGYDGSICVSVDAFHKQNLIKVASFIKAVIEKWERNDMVSIACVEGASEKKTKIKILELSKKLGANYANLGGGRFCIDIIKIDLSPVGKALCLKNPWGRRWFKEDYCQGPGNVLSVMPDGTVKPCCGYAADEEALTIGNIKRDSIKRIIRNAYKNPYVYAVFNIGLNGIRRRLEKAGIKFPGRTSNHCYFCHYIQNNVPKETLKKCLGDIS